eukprot:2529809-Rhodomonas_salina.1
MVAYESCNMLSASALVKIAGREHKSMAQEPGPSSRKVVIEVREVDADVRASVKSAQMWYTISNTAAAAGKVTSGKTDGVFGTRHEIIMDHDDQIVFKVKHCRSMLQRNATVGSFSTSMRNFDGFVPLLDAEGQTVGNVHLAITVSDVFPTLHLTACPWTKNGHTVKREFECDGQTLHVRHYNGMNIFAVNHNSKRVAARRSDDTWSIMAPDDNKCMHLKSSPDCSEFELTNAPDYSLVKGNLFERCTLEGTWTLIKGKDAVAVINVAGPFVSCCSPSDMAMALAIGNAMYISTILNQRVWDTLTDRMIQLRAIKDKFSAGAASVACGQNFFVFGAASYLESCMKNVSVGTTTWMVEHNYLRRNIVAHPPSSDHIAATIASELGWSDFSFLF